MGGVFGTTNHGFCLGGSDGTVIEKLVVGMTLLRVELG